MSTYYRKNAEAWDADSASCSSGPRAILTPTRDGHPTSPTRTCSLKPRLRFPSRRARTSPSYRSDPSTPNPRQPRTVFDEDAPPVSWWTRSREVGLAPADRGAAHRRGDRFELVMGERRWRAALALPASTPFPPSCGETEDHDLLRDALLENLHRAQLNPLEEAAAYPADARRLRLHTGRAVDPDQAVAAADLQHHQVVEAAAVGAAQGGGRSAERRPRSGALGFLRSGGCRSGWLSGLWPRGCPSGRSRSSSRWGRPATSDRKPRRSGRTRRWRRRPRTWPARLSDLLGYPGPGRPRAGPRAGSPSSSPVAEDLERIAELIDARVDKYDIWSARSAPSGVGSQVDRLGLLRQLATGCPWLPSARPRRTGTVRCRPVRSGSAAASSSEPGGPGRPR